MAKPVTPRLATPLPEGEKRNNIPAAKIAVITLAASQALAGVTIVILALPHAVIAAAVLWSLSTLQVVVISIPLTSNENLPTLDLAKKAQTIAVETLPHPLSPPPPSPSMPIIEEAATHHEEASPIPPPPSFSDVRESIQIAQPTGASEISASIAAVAQSSAQPPPELTIEEEHVALPSAELLAYYQLPEMNEEQKGFLRETFHDLAHMKLLTLQAKADDLALRNALVLDSKGIHTLQALEFVLIDDSQESDLQDKKPLNTFLNLKTTLSAFLRKPAKSKFLSGEAETWNTLLKDHKEAVKFLSYLPGFAKRTGIPFTELQGWVNLYFKDKEGNNKQTLTPADIENFINAIITYTDKHMQEVKAARLAAKEECQSYKSYLVRQESRAAAKAKAITAIGQASASAPISVKGKEPEVVQKEVSHETATSEIAVTPKVEVNESVKVAEQPLSAPMPLPLSADLHAVDSSVDSIVAPLSDLTETMVVQNAKKVAIYLQQNGQRHINAKGKRKDWTTLRQNGRRVIKHAQEALQQLQTLKITSIAKVIA